MVETMVVSGIVVVAVVLAVRSLCRTLSGRSRGCHCGSASCSFADVCRDMKPSARGPSVEQQTPRTQGHVRWPDR